MADGPAAPASPAGAAFLSGPSSFSVQALASNSRMPLMLLEFARSSASLMPSARKPCAAQRRSAAAAIDTAARQSPARHTAEVVLQLPMSDEKNGAILDFLRGRFARLDDRLDRIDHKLDEVITRLGIVERDVAGIKMDFAAMNLRLDNISRRLDRVERRLELVDGALPREA